MAKGSKQVPKQASRCNTGHKHKLLGVPSLFILCRRGDKLGKKEVPYLQSEHNTGLSVPPGGGAPRHGGALIADQPLGTLGSLRLQQQVKDGEQKGSDRGLATMPFTEDLEHVKIISDDDTVIKGVLQELRVDRNGSSHSEERTVRISPPDEPDIFESEQDERVVCPSQPDSKTN